jgi:hypothetical protein
LTYVLLGCGLALVELWAIVSQRDGIFYALPFLIRLMMPVLIAFVAFRRPPAEWIPIALFGAGFWLALIRDLTGDPAAGHVVVIACGLGAAWFGHSLGKRT